MRTRTLIHTIPVTAQGQMIHFSVNLPRDCKRVIGVHTGVVMITAQSNVNFPPSTQGLILKRNVNAGVLRLQSFERAGWCLTHDVSLQERNLYWDNLPQSAIFSANAFTHGISHFTHVDLVVGGESTQLKGYYKDVWPSTALVRYDVKLYVFLEIKKPTP